MLPWEASEGWRYEEIVVLDNLVAFVVALSDSACRVARYDLGGVLLSDQTIPCKLDALPASRQDGRLIASPTFSGLVA